MDTLARIPYEQIIVNPETFPNARCDFKDLEGLSKSIERFGLLDSIRLWRTPDGEYVLADGIRRYAAIELLHERNLDRWNDLFAEGIPSELIFGDKTLAIDISVLLNVNRESYNQAEEALAFAILRDRGLSSKETHTLIGRSVRHINRLLKFKDDSTQENFGACARGEISFSAALAISRRAREEQAEAVEKMKKEAAKSPKERNVTDMKAEMTKLGNQEMERVQPTKKPGRGRQPGPQKPPRPRVSEIKSKLETVNSDQEVLLKQYEGRPQTAQDLDENPSHAGHVVHFQYQLGWAEGARAALEWSLGDRDDVC